MTDTEDRARFAEAVALANVPTLLMVLVQMTGDERWLGEPYLPTKSRGLSDNETGGLPAEIQQEIRDAALEAILAWRDGAAVANPTPTADQLVTMMGVAMGESVPDEYAAMIDAELQAGDRSLDDSTFEAVDVPPGFSALIIGAGISGLCTAVRLQQMGVPFTIVERQHDVGGVWLANRYPGAAVDTPGHLYSFSFAPHDWTRFFADQPEILGYVRRVADEFGVRQHIRFGVEVLSADYDSATQTWVVATRDSDGLETTMRASVVFSAVGAFNKAKVPKVEGAETFGGPAFHTAEWPDDVDLTGKRVAVVGNGASAMQVVPAIVDRVASLVVFQHSPQWAAPFEKFQEPVPPAVRFLLAEVPLYYAWYRARLAWIFNDRLHASLQKDPDFPHPERALNVINDAHRRQLSAYIESELGDRQDLLDAVLPTYPPFGKRMLLDNGWFRTLARDEVTVETDRIARIEPYRLITESGHVHEVDVLVWATGFDVVRFLAPMEIRGRDGVRLHDVWEDDNPRAFLGTAVPGFPNFFMLYGPNLQFGHGGSLIGLVERQVHYVLSLLRSAWREGVSVVEVRPDVHDAYNERLEAAHERMVWTHPGMDTYYRNARGRVVVNNPLRMVDFFQATETADLRDYTTV